MNSAENTQKTASPSPRPALDLMLMAIGNPARWRMLQALAGGEPRSLAELAEAGGCSYQSGVKHMLTLREAGLVVQGRGYLYQIPAQYLPQPGQPVVDYGHCLLRLEAATA
jgi:biotin operon repressor